MLGTVLGALIVTVIVTRMSAGYARCAAILVVGAAAPALLTEVFPAAADRAKDLGLINAAYNLPLVVGPLVAGVVLGLVNSYPALFAVAGVVTVLAAATVTRVRSVRRGITED
jgi:MFS family permease